MSDYRLKIGITQGDVNGVGWEVILRTFADQRIAELFTPVIYGSLSAAKYYMSILDTEDYGVQFNVVKSADDARRGKINLIDTGDATPQPGVPSAEGGKAAVEALEAAIVDLREGAIDAMVTAPINKETAQSDAFRFTGHTEFMAAHLDGEPMMIMCSDRLRVGLVTIHIPVAEVSQSITKEKIISSLSTLRQSLKEDFGIVEPRIAVLSLNPHAGEGGMLGTEEHEFGANIMVRPPEPMERGKVFEYDHEMEDLIDAMAEVASRSERKAPPPISNFSQIVSHEPYPVANKAGEILGRLKQWGITSFRTLFKGSRSRSEVVATFIAVLELCKARMIHLAGSETDCTVTPTGEGGDSLTL